MFPCFSLHVEHAPNGLRSGAGAGVDYAWDQEKLKARKMLENAAESPASSARFVRLRHF